MKKQDNVYRDFKTEMDMTPRGFGLPKKLWRQLFERRLPDPARQRRHLVSDIDEHDEH